LVKSSGDMSPISQLKKDNNDLISDVYIWKKSSVAFVLRGKSGFDVLLSFNVVIEQK
jgi:hypothetical protein